MAPHRRTRAFTLVELALTMAVIGMLLLVSLPSLATLGSTSLSVSARHVSEYFTWARSQAIAKNTVVRVGIVTEWPGQAEAPYHKLAAWIWDPAEENYIQLSAWKTLNDGAVFERDLPEYVEKAEYAKDDPSLILGDFPAKNFQPDDRPANEGVRLRCFDFLPNGSARNTGKSGTRTISVVLVQGYYENDRLFYTSEVKGRNDPYPRNWAQVNVDTLTGNVDFLRP